MKSLLTAVLLLLLSLPAAAQEADLRLEANGVYGLDGSVRVTVAVLNAGPDDVSDVDITAQFDLSTVTASELDAGCSNSAIGVVCSFSEIDAPVLAVDEELVVEFVLTPAEDAGDVQLDVTSTVTDPDEANNDDSVPLIPAAMANVGIDERGIDAPGRNTLVFSVGNEGPDSATEINVSGTVTVDFGDPLDGAAADALTGMTDEDGAVCGRQVPDSTGTFDRWTFPVSCSVRDLDAGESVEFSFWFEEADNAQFRLSVRSASLDTEPADNIEDGDFLSSPLEVIEAEEEPGCCATTRGRPVHPVWLLLVATLVAIRRARHSPCV